MPLQIIRQDITKMHVDAIVNTTNSDMVGYSGVDAAIHRAAGPELDNYCKTVVPIDAAKPVITDGYNLPCKHIIHTCGPVWNGGGEHEEEQLKRCYNLCLSAAVNNGFETVAFPLISSGNYGYPKKPALNVAVKIITDFLFDNEITVFLCVFDKTSYELSQQIVTPVESFVDENCSRIKSECSFDYCCSAEPTKRGFSNSPTRHRKLKIQNEMTGSVVQSEMPESLEHLIKNIDKSFSETLFQLIDEKGMTDVECYKKANVTRKTFSKIRCDRNYRPSRETAVAFALALELSLDETNAFLGTAGFTLSSSSVFDTIVMYHIRHNDYNVNDINIDLFNHDQTTIGCMV